MIMIMTGHMRMERIDSDSFDYVQFMVLKGSA